METILSGERIGLYRIKTIVMVFILPIVNTVPKSSIYPLREVVELRISDTKDDCLIR